VVDERDRLGAHLQSERCQLPGPAQLIIRSGVEVVFAAHEEDRRVRLTIRNGRLELGSLECPGFGSAVVPDLSTTASMPKATWPAQQ
jgi:hypothetical protein